MQTRDYSQTKFSLDDTDVFARPGAEITPRGGDDWRAGVHVKFPNDWALSIQWGAGNYGSNYDAPISRSSGVPDATEAEIAVLEPQHGDLVDWANGDSVQGWCSMERVQRVLDLMAAGELMREIQDPPPPPRLAADDGWDA